MPKYIVYCTDAPNTLEKRLALRPQHLARLEALAATGQLILAGPNPVNADNLADGVLGSTLVVDFETRTQLDAWLGEDPFVLEGVYQHVEVRPFLQVFPK